MLVRSMSFGTALLFFLSFATTPAGANHDGSETCVLDFTDTEPDWICFSIDWLGSIDRYETVDVVDQPNDILWLGTVELEVCVGSTCAQNIPAIGVGQTSACDAYTLVESCTVVSEQPVKEKGFDPVDTICLEDGHLDVFAQEHGNGPGIDNIPVQRTASC